MKRDLILIRHLPSEANIAVDAIQERGDYNPSEAMKGVTHTQYRLTPEGIKKYGIPIRDFLAKEFPNFDRCYTSDMVRAVETALVLNKLGAYCPAKDEHIGWEISPLLRERFWGSIEQPGRELAGLVQYHKELRTREDIFTWLPPNGEPFGLAMLRARVFLHDVHDRRFKRALAITHGDFFMACDAVIREMTSLDTNGSHYFNNGVPHNGAIIHYRTTTEFPSDNPKQQNPFYFEEFRMTSRDKPTEFGPWERIRHGGRTPEEMLDYVNRFNHVFS